MMTQERMTRVRALLETGKSKGIDVSISHDKLVARLPSDKTGSETFLNELRLYRIDVKIGEKHYMTVGDEDADMYAVRGSREIPETDLDMKVYFFNSRERLEISVHYDCDLYDEQVVNDLITDYLDFIRESIQ